MVASCRYRFRSEAKARRLNRFFPRWMSVHERNGGNQRTLPLLSRICSRNSPDLRRQTTRTSKTRMRLKSQRPHSVRQLPWVTYVTVIGAVAEHPQIVVMDKPARIAGHKPMKVSRGAGSSRLTKPGRISRGTWACLWGIETPCRTPRSSGRRRSRAPGPLNAGRLTAIAWQKGRFDSHTRLERTT